MSQHGLRFRWTMAAGAAALLASSVLATAPFQSPAVPVGVREPAWAPDGRRLAVSWLDEIWTMTPDGRDERRVVTSRGDWVGERDPAWSSDGRQIAFAADTAGAYDLYVVPSTGGAARKVSSLDGDERWPSWTTDGRLVFSHRAPHGAWQLHVVAPDGTSAPTRLTPDSAAEWQGQVSRDGRRLVFVSDRDREAGDNADVFVRDLSGENLVRVTRGGGEEQFPAWAPESDRVSFLGTRQGMGTGVFVAELPDADGASSATGPAGRGGRAGGRGGAASSGLPLVLASRRAGTSAWSPDGQMLAIATVSTASAGYNGDPNRNDADPPAAFADEGAQQLWRVAAPRPVDAQARAIAVPAPGAGRWVGQFDRVWQTLKSLYYKSGESAVVWDTLRATHRPAALAARSADDVEAAVDALVAAQPLIKPAVESTTGVVASGNPLASEAGARMLAKGGNIVDAIVATSFALGVVEPDASGLGGDGQAIVFLKGMSQPVVIEYKDMTPMHATVDNPKIFRDGQRTAGDGPTVANIPGTVAGLDLLFQKYGSGKVTWADVLAPAIELAEQGYILDEALPTTVAVGRSSFEKYPEAAKIYLPGGNVPKPGDRFINKDLAETLKVLAKEGGQSFYRGSIARRIAADMEENGGIITLEDLAQYRAMERVPLQGTFRGHKVFSVPPPVSTGLQIVETLQILDGYTPRPGATYATDADYFHHAIEAWRVRDGGAQIADPERWPVNLGNHLDQAHARERFALIKPDAVYSPQQGGRGRGGGPVSVLNDFQRFDQAVADGTAGSGTQTGTTSFAAADAQGNMVAITQTLSTWGGNFYVSKGLGFLYNDHFRGGRGGTGFGSMLPLMRSSSTSVPTLVFAPSGVDPGDYGIPGFTPRLAVGAAGNAWIPASVYDIILNVVDGHMGAQQAIEAPRFLIGNAPGGGSRVQIEDRIPATILKALEARGHSFAKVGRKGEVKYGYAAVAVVNAAKGTVEGGAEPRRSHGVR